MNELTHTLLLRLLDSQDPVEIPARLVRLLATEAMQFREHAQQHGELEDELRQRCAELLEKQRSGTLPPGSLQRYAALNCEGNLQLATQQTIQAALRFTAGKYAAGCWVPRDLLEQTESAISDSINHGSPTQSNRDQALSELRLALDDEKDPDAANLWVARELVQHALTALGEAMYGRAYSQAYRDELQARLEAVLAASDAD